MRLLAPCYDEPPLLVEQRYAGDSEDTKSNCRPSGDLGSVVVAGEESYKKLFLLWRPFGKVL